MINTINRNRDFIKSEINRLQDDFSWSKLRLIMDYAEENGITMSWDISYDGETVLIFVGDDVSLIDL